MSKHAKGQKGRVKTNTPPAENGWVYACPTGLPTPKIAAAVGVVGQPVTEVSAHSWQQDWQMTNSFMDAYGYPKTYRFPPDEHVNWDAFKDWMLVKQSQAQQTTHIEGFRFVGELVIVHASWEATEDTVAFLLDIVQAHVNWSHKQYHAQARIVLVLEGWERPSVEGRVVGKRVAWAINPLPLPHT
jgi:hypothetical protein